MDHLLPNIRKVALLPAKERIARIKKEYWIGYNRAELALNKLEDLFDYPRKLRMKNLLIIGPSNNGKTMIVEKFRRSHLPYESENGEHEIIPVLMIQMPSNPSTTFLCYYSQKLLTHLFLITDHPHGMKL